MRYTISCVKTTFAQHCGEFSALFALSVEKKYCREVFCRQLMTGEYAKELDSISVDSELPCAVTMLQRYQELYKPLAGTNFVGIEVMRWIGHMYCYWHLTRGEPSLEIYNQADFF